MATRSRDFTAIPLTRGVTLMHHRSKRWKTELVQMIFVNPIDSGIAARSLGANLLRHGHSGVRGMARVSETLQDLYGATMSAYVSRTVGNQLFIVKGSTCARRYLPDGSDPLAGLVELVSRSLEDPWAAHPEADPAIFKNESTNLLRAIDSVFDQKPQYAERRLVEELYGPNQLAIPAYGRRDDVCGLTCESTTRALVEMTRSAPVLCYAVTPRSDREIARVFTKALGLGARRAFRRADPEIPAPRKRKKVVVETDRVAQSRIAAAFRVKNYDAERDAYPALFGDVIFGGESFSRLFKNVREKESLAYSIGSSFDDRIGTLHVSGGIDAQNLDRVLELVQKDVRSFAKGSITDAEMSLAMTAIDRSLKMVRDTQAGVVGFHVGKLFSGRKEKSIKAVLDRYRRVTKAEIADVFGRLALDTMFALKSEGKVADPPPDDADALDEGEVSDE